MIPPSNSPLVVPQTANSFRSGESINAKSRIAPPTYTNQGTPANQGLCQGMCEEVYFLIVNEGFKMNHKKSCNKKNSVSINNMFATPALNFVRVDFVESLHGFELL